MKYTDILEEYKERFGEWLEHADNSAMERILASALIQERQKSDYLEKRLKSMEIQYGSTCTTN